MLLTSLASCKMADFTLMSTRNFDSKENYVLLKSNAHKGSFNFTKAVDKTVSSVEGGTYLTNVRITKGLFGHYGVKADVWGLKTNSVADLAKNRN